MKISGQSSLIAAQALGVRRSSAEARAASAAFFAELKKTTPAAAAPATQAPVKSAPATAAIAQTTPLREAPLRTGAAPLPPGSLLNIVV